MKRREFLTLLASSVALPQISWGAEEGQLRIATFAADVTPPLGAVLCHGNVTPAKKIVDPLSARGVILLADQQPIVLCAVDWVGIGNGAHDAWRAALAQAVGTSPDRVAVHCVHQHDAPGIDDSTEEILAANGMGGRMFDVAYAREARERTARAAGEAVAKARTVTHVGCGKGVVEKVASNRRILGPDGRCVMTRMSSCRNAKAIAAPEGIIDPYVRAISFWNDDRPLAVLTYYATHPQSYYGRGGVSADFVGMARSMRETAIPGIAHIHFNGAGGDIAAGKYNDGSPERRPILAQRLGEGMQRAWEATEREPIRARDVRWRVCPVRLPVRESITKEACLEKVRDQNLRDRDRRFAARDLAWLERMNSGHRIPLGCLRLRDEYVLHMPGELCIGYQLAAQAMRPDDFVSMAAYGDLGPGYICQKIAYSQGGYETGWVSRVAPNVEEALMVAVRQLLAVNEGK